MRRLLASLLVAVYCATAATPALAQSPTRVYRVAVLHQATNERLGWRVSEELAKLGYVKDRNLILELRASMGDSSLLRKHAEEIARMGVDVVYTPNTGAAVVMHEATKTIPIVMGSADPVGAGLVRSLARPGGNVTGTLYPLIELAAKRTQMLKEFLPNLSRMTILWNPSVLTTKEQVAAAQAAATELGVTSESIEVRNDAELERTFAAMSRVRPQAVFMVQDPYFLNASEKIAAFMLVINEKAALALGVEIPRRVLVRATDIIR